MKERGLSGLLSNDGGVGSETVARATRVEQVVEALHWTAAKGGVAVIKMGHYMGAKNLAGGLLALRKCGLENEGRGVLPSYKTTTVAPPPPPPSEEPVDANKDETALAAAVLAPQDDETDESNGKVPNLQQQQDPEATVEQTIISQEEGLEMTPKYTKEEEVQHLATLQQLQQMRIYHLANYHIPNPPNIPPDMIIPQPDPVPQDPMVTFRLLESLTALRLHYEEGGGGGGAANASLSSSNGGAGRQKTNVDDQWGGHAAAATGEDDPDNDNPSNYHGLKLDKDKIAAAAGGGAYDEENDPLNAPDVVNAVLEFKRKLETRDVSSRRRRVDIITVRMAKKVRELVEEGRKERRRREDMLLQQQQKREEIETSAAATTASLADSGQRGVSNLPAWMTNDNNDGVEPTSTSHHQQQQEDEDEATTKKRKFIPSEANRDINVRKQRLDVEGGQSLSEIRAANEAADKKAAAAVSSFVVQTTKEGILSAESKFPPLSSSADSLKLYVTAQIVDYLGEEEKTLIDFIMKELAKEGGCNISKMLDEMKMVLDEDAEDFVVNLYRKMAE